MRYGMYASDHGSWKAGLLVAVLALVGARVAFQFYLDHKLDVAQAQWEVEIDKAQSLAQAAQQRLARLQAASNALRDTVAAKDLERIRMEAHRSHQQYLESLAQAEREREQAQWQANRDQQDAAASSRNQIAALQRALAMPMPR